MSTEGHSQMELDIEKRLFDIPAEVEFPMELCHHMKSKLHSVLEQNWHLKRHVDYLDKEVIELRKLKVEKQQQESHCPNIQDGPDQPSSLMASKIVELSKKNRDMTAQIESMKTKMTKLLTENEKFRGSQTAPSIDDKSQVECISIEKTADEEAASSQQLSQLTTKMMEYRRQCQQLRMELRTALRALSQEVGEGITPQKVLNTVSSSSWRGRQQIIIALQQKIVDLNSKVSNNGTSSAEVFSSGFHGGEGDNCIVECNEIVRKRSGYGNEKAWSTHSSLASSVTPSHKLGLMQQDMKKQAQIRRLTEEVEKLTDELKHRQQELKANKARTQTLEIQARSFRCQIDMLEAKIQEKDHESKEAWNETNQMKRELLAAKDRDRRARDKINLEIQEANRSLARERAIVVRLQQVINEKQEALQRTDGEMIELRNKLELCCATNVKGGVNAIEKIQELETRLLHYSALIANSEKEHKKFMEMMESSISETEEERQKVIKAQRQSAKIFTVLQQANKCIDDCLDAAQITDTNLLQEVENIRTLIRELKTGDIYSLDEEPLTGMSTKKLRTKVNMLIKEVRILQANLRELSDARQTDLNNYKILSEI